MKKLAAGNWKMNGSVATLTEVATLLEVQSTPICCEMLLCPPATLLSQMAAMAVGTALKVGGQNCHTKDSGAHTGEISAKMLRDAGAAYVIVGHSERRADHGETDALIRAKAIAAQSVGLIPIVCIGETGNERDAGATLDVIGTQLHGSVPDGATAATLVVAYEPVWAIGTDHTPTVEQIAKVHAFIRTRLTARLGTEATDVRILYGGSVKPSNANKIFAIPHVNGALVGGASLKAADFAAIVTALSAS